MSNKIKSWDVQVGDVYQIDSLSFSKEDLFKFRSEEIEAIRSLSSKVLNSRQGIEIASRIYNETQAPLTFAVAFKSSSGLILRVNGKEHQILTAEEVLGGRHGSYMKEIKKISEAAKRQGIGTGVQAPCSEKVQAIFQQTAKARLEESKISLVGKVKAFCMDVAGFFVNAISIIRNSTTAALPAALYSIGGMGIAGGALLSLIGIYLTVVSLANCVEAFARGNQERKCLALSNLMLGISALGFGLSYMMTWGATFAKNAAVAAASGALLPFVLFGMYISSTASNIYKAVVIRNFRKELTRIMEQKDLSQSEKLYAAMLWMQQKTHLSDLEEKESAARASLEGENLFEKIGIALQRKWDAFALRAGEEAHALIEEVFETRSSDLLLQRLKSGDEEALAQAEAIVQRVLKKSGEQLFWNLLGIACNLVGSLAMMIYLAVAGPAGSIASSVIFAISAFLSLFVDVAYFRKIAVDVKDNFSVLASAILTAFIAYYRSSDMTKAEALELAIEKFREWKKKKCPESENRLQEEECQRSETSLTTSDRKEDLLKTQSMPTEETSLLSQAS